MLVIEDNPGDIRLIQEALKESSILESVEFLKDGNAAIDYLEKVKQKPSGELPNLILLDLNLPNKSGFDLLKIIKFDETLKPIPVIVLSTSQNPQDISRAYGLHANCYLTKPVDFEPFINIVKAVEYFWTHLAKLPAS